MIDYDAIKKAIADAVENATGLIVIYANQNAPVPSSSYATVFVTPSLKTGYDGVSYVNNDTDPDLTETVEGLRQITASINFYKDDAILNASNFVSQLQSATMIQFFKDQGLGFGGVSDIRDISEIDKQLWQERAQLDLTFFAVSEFSSVTTSIESINIEGRTESGNNFNDFNTPISEV